MGLGLSVSVRRCSSLSAEELEELYTFSNGLMAEARASFLNHVSLQDLAFLFRAGPEKQLVGISMWRTVDSDNPRVKVIVQGKLRIAQAYRRRSLHVVAGLLYFAWQKLLHPFTQYFFFTIASVFNWVSMRRSVGRYYILNGRHSSPEERAIVEPLYPILERTVKEDNFEIEEDTGAINVHVMIQQETFDEYPDSYFELPEAREYIALNPRYREGRDICYVYPFSAGNVLSMLWRCIQQSWLDSHRRIGSSASSCSTTKETTAQPSSAPQDLPQA